MALIGLLLDLQKFHQWQLHVWHGNHGWHENSAIFASEIKQWCIKKNLSFYMTEGVHKETKNESIAREWRYQNLKKTAEVISKKNNKEPCLHILTGHTSSDRAETFILNLARGTDLAGLGSMSSTRNLGQGSKLEKKKLIRPMLCFSREETRMICSDMNLPIWIDPSNQNTKLSRNKIRHTVIPILEELHPGCSIRIASLSERIGHYKKDENTLIELAMRILKNDKGLCRKELMNIPKTSRAKVLAYWLKEKGIPNISSTQLEEISQVIGPTKKPGERYLAAGWIITWDKDSIHIKTK